MSNDSDSAAVHFEPLGPKLSVEITRNRRSPVIGSLHHALFALGIVVASYQALPGVSGLVERVVLERDDGGTLEGELSSQAKAAILPIALG